MSFTPGPWLVRTSPTCIGRCFAIGTLQNIDRGHGYATLYDDRTSLNPFGDGEAEANANLISAAPDMFAAIDAADTAFAVLNVQDLGGQARECIREAWPLVQSARAKARPDSGYADAVAEVQQHEIARLDAVVACLLHAINNLLVWDDGNLPGDLIEELREASVAARVGT